MKLTQLSLFIENKPAHLKEPCRLLAEAGVNIITMSLADTQQFGILRLIVQDWRKAKAALEAAGCVVNTTEVVAIQVPHHPGGLADLLEAIERCNINIEYMYAFGERQDENAAIVFRFEDTDAAIAALKSCGVDPMNDVSWYDKGYAG